MEAPSPERSALMGRVRQANTGPELLVRRAAHALGFRFRLHRRDLPGSPDVVFPRLRLALFIHGCFWHRHEGCRRASMPKKNYSFWNAKFDANVERDRRAEHALEALGWSSEVIWECETKEPEHLSRRLQNILKSA